MNQDSHRDPKNKHRALAAALQAAKATVALLEAELADAERDGGASDVWLDLAAIAARWQVGREAVRGAAARGELEVRQGSRRRLLVRESEMVRWLESRRYAPGPRRAAEPEPANDDALGELVASGELVARGGGR